MPKSYPSETNLTLDELSESNAAQVHQFCEKNVKFWSQPLRYFRQATLGDSRFEPELTLVVREKHTDKVVGFFMGTTRKSVFLSARIKNYLKFFVVDISIRRKGVASWLLKNLYQKFKTLGHKGKIYVLTTPPDYWFSGVNPKFTPAYFWLQKNGFRRRRFHNSYRQDLYVDLENNPIVKKFEKKPIIKINGYKIARVTPEYFDKTYDFVKEEFFGAWCEEAKLSFKNDPATTYIAIEPDTDQVVGFATYNAHFYGSFGPTGIRKDLRGKGVGSVLLKWTLLDMKRNNQKRCQILWVVGDTVKYYSKVVGAYIGEIYFPMKSKIS